MLGHPLVVFLSERHDLLEGVLVQVLYHGVHARAVPLQARALRHAHADRHGVGAAQALRRVPANARPAAEHVFEPTPKSAIKRIEKIAFEMICKVNDEIIRWMEHDNVTILFKTMSKIAIAHRDNDVTI